MGLRACVTLNANVMRALAAAPPVVAGCTDFSGSNVRSPCAWQGRRTLRRVLAPDRQPPCQASCFQRTAWHGQSASSRCVAHAAASTTAAPVEGLSSTQQQQIDVFVSFLLEENAKYNLTGAKDAEEVRRHVRDCLALLPLLDAAAAATTAAKIATSPQTSTPAGLPTGQPAAAAAPAQAFAAQAAEPPPAGLASQPVRLLDVGSGAGLPGLLLAVCRPHWQVLMLDALRKRCGFMEAAAGRMGLANVTAVWARAEDAGHDPQLRETCDVVTARAVAEMPALAELCLPFVRPGGQLVVAKGAAPQDEVRRAGRAIRLLGGRLRGVELVDSHDSQRGRRTAVLVDKAGRTPARYPRTPQQLKRQPLV